jgi:cardiolipin synthase
MSSSRVLTIPNILTFMRMALIPIFAILLYYQEFGWSLVVFLAAGLSDGLDGFIARRFDQQSSLGLIIDPAADKLLMTTAFVALTIPGVVAGRHLPIPFWVTALVIGRDVLIIVVAAAIHIVTGFRGFRPSWLGKASTGVQVAAIGLVLIAAAFPSINGIYLPTVYAVVAAFAFLSGVHYIFYVAKLLNDEARNR